MTRPTLTRAAIAALLAVLALLGTAPQALAHTSLTGSDPAKGAKVDVAPKRVTLTFDEPVQSGDVNQLVVTDPSGGQWAHGPVSVDGNEVSRALGQLGPAGEYTIGFRVLSEDGHPVTREIPFTYTTGTSAAPETTAGTSGTNQREDDAGVPVWVWVVGAVALLGAGGALAVRLGRE